ncbi:hypothetical protein RIF29_38688 [Crotalaria pallida]|uniref:peptidylprolyl isomerase n=1 Tax=Crotalaria pallida TaxID=3830 RepID=A0AAN9E0H1_CROPI
MPCTLVSENRSCWSKFHECMEDMEEFNCYSLNSIGPTVESFSGPRRYLVVYFAFAIASSAMSYRFCKMPAVGASGEIFGLVKKESWDLNTQEKIEAAGKKKEEGNVLFKAGKYARASKRYEQAIKYIEYDTSFSEDEKKQAKALKVACNLNNATSKLKLKEYKEAEKLCTKVLDLESTNVKSLYRRAQTYIHLADLDLAEFDIKKALEIDLDNRYAL